MAVEIGIISMLQNISAKKYLVQVVPTLERLLKFMTYVLCLVFSKIDA